MEPLSPRSTNHPPRQRRDMKKSTAVQKVQNPDKIDDKWCPAAVIPEPGNGNSYRIGKKLGKGGFAVCFEGSDLKTEKIYAMKIVKSHVEQKKQLEKASCCLRSRFHSSDCSLSFAQNFKSTPKCVTQILSSFTKLLPSRSTLMSSLSCVPTAR